MKSAYVNELAANQVVTSTFLVRSKEIRQKKTGEPYLALVLGDKSGDIEAKMWDNVTEVMETFDTDDFVKVKGVPSTYNNRPQLTVHKLQRIEESEVDPGDYFAVSRRDPEEMLAELRQFIGSIGNPYLKSLLETVFANQETLRKFRRAPAAKSIHHNFIGGLIEHVLSLCALCRQVGPHYPLIDVDLLLTGAILHDIGKIEELQFERGISYSTRGQLLGHINIGMQMVEDAIRAIPGFPPRLNDLVLHLILSHHGKLEFGSPKLPVFAEALLLHYLDDMDSKMESMRATLEKDHLMEGDWTGYNYALERIVLRKAEYLESAEEPRGKPSPPPASSAPGAPETRLQMRGGAAQPAAPPPSSRVPADKQRPRQPETQSLFGERLADALKKEDE